MVLPTIPEAAGIDMTPSISVTEVTAGGVISFVVSTTGVAASVPVPAIGQLAPKEELSNAVVPETMFVVQAPLCQSGLLSFRTPKFEPPVTSR